MGMLGRLLRISLAPTAAADVACGLVLGAGAWPGGADPWLVILASLFVYHGGMALNDWADRERDRVGRPGRPLPSGALLPGAALGIALAMLLAGAILAWLVRPQLGWLLSSVAALAALYDLGGRGAWLGPSLLALCRAGNLGAGILLGLLERGVSPRIHDAWIPLVYAGFVFLVARLARLEDGEDPAPLGRRPSRYLASAAALLLVLPVVPIPWLPLTAAGTASAGLFLARHRILLASLAAAAGALGLLRMAFRRGGWTRARVVGSTGMALRRLLVFDAAAALSSGTSDGLYVALLVLLAFPASHALGRIFPPS